MTNDKYLIFTNSGGNPVAKYLRILILQAVKCPHPGRGGGGGGCGAGDGADHDNYQNTAHRTVALGLDIWHPPSDVSSTEQEYFVKTGGEYKRLKTL